MHILDMVLGEGHLSIPCWVPPQVIKENVEIAQSIRQECVQRSFKKSMEVPVSQIQVWIVQVGKVISK